MPTAYKTPDVYVEEIALFPPSVAEVGTAIPAFIGYTEKAPPAVAPATKPRPTKIFSMKDYEAYFGFPKADKLAVALLRDSTVPDGFTATVSAPTLSYLMYLSLKLFFDNGGVECYVVSIGPYTDPATLNVTDYTDGLAMVALEDEPTLIVIPEAVNLTSAEYTSLVQAVLAQCGTLGDRFGIFDIFRGNIPLTSDTSDDSQSKNRGYFGTNHLKYGAVYYPHIKTSFNYYIPREETNVGVAIDGGGEATLDTLKTTDTGAYNFAKKAIKDRYVTLPPSAAVAGIYAATDASRGVWKAPANVSLADVIEPVVKLDSKAQESLNVDPTSGVSINAIRAFAGRGTLVWGARTLAGNDNEWRYVSVRRFFNLVEESIKKSTYWAVFEPNDANTWVKVRGMITNYLTDKWRDGALAGATPKDAFFVKCGLGTTMTAQDILEGRMNVEVGLAAVRPAEFIVLKFSHKLQTS